MRTLTRRGLVFVVKCKRIYKIAVWLVIKELHSYECVYK